MAANDIQFISPSGGLYPFVLEDLGLRGDGEMDELLGDNSGLELVARIDRKKNRSAWTQIEGLFQFPIYHDPSKQVILFYMDNKNKLGLRKSIDRVSTELGGLISRFYPGYIECVSLYFNFTCLEFGIRVDLEMEYDGETGYGVVISTDVIITKINCLAKRYYWDKFVRWVDMKWTGDKVRTSMEEFTKHSVEYVGVYLYTYERAIHNHYFKDIHNELLPNVWRRIHKRTFYKALYDELMPIAWHTNRLLDWCLDVEELEGLKKRWGL